MADLLWDLISPPDGRQVAVRSKEGLGYLEHLASQPLTSLVGSEVPSQAQALHSLHLSLQSTCKRSHKPIVNSADHHSRLSRRLVALERDTADLHTAIPDLDHAAVRFSSAFAKTTAPGPDSSSLLRRRRRALILSRNCERLVDLMGLPNLLEAAAASSASSSSAATSLTSSSSSSASATNSSSALDLNVHITRLHALYPDSALVSSVSSEAQAAMRTMACNLVMSLRHKSLKLAAAVRAVGWLRRILPELGSGGSVGGGIGGSGTAQMVPDTPAEREQCLISIFLACRTATLLNMIADLEALRLLAEKESVPTSSDSRGQHTERYLKRYIEVFREQSFSVLSVLKSLFPASRVPTAAAASSSSTRPSGPVQAEAETEAGACLNPIDSPISTFSSHLVDILVESLARYLGNVQNQTLYDSLVTQVMYCAASLGRLGADFGVLLACLGAASGDKWAASIKRHKALTNRLESVVSDRKDQQVPVSSIKAPWEYNPVV